MKKSIGFLIIALTLRYGSTFQNPRVFKASSCNVHGVDGGNNIANSHCSHLTVLSLRPEERVFEKLDVSFPLQGVFDDEEREEVLPYAHVLSDPSISSNVSTLAKPLQATVLFAILATLGQATFVMYHFLTDVTLQYEWMQSFRYSWSLLLGVSYTATGVTHFTNAEEYRNIVPPRGTWGVWYPPFASRANFHVRWTGLVAMLGGVGMFVGGLYDALAPVYVTSPYLVTMAGLMSDSAAALFLLTILVTPANVFMYTHGAKLPRDGPDVPWYGHLTRAALQVLWASMLYEVAEGTFDEVFAVANTVIATSSGA